MEMKKRGAPKTPVGQPCRNGHPYNRSPKGVCRVCRAAQRVRNKAAKKPPAWLGADTWVWQAHKQLRRRSAGPRPTVKELFDLWLAQGKRCAITGLPVDGVPHLDHVVPVSIGGTNALRNLQWTSAMANIAKNKYSVKETREWILAAADSIRAHRLF